MSRAYAKVNNEILKWSRENTPYTILDVAKKLDVKEEKITDWEEGKSYPTIRQAMNLAELYKLPFATFYYTTIPQKPIKKYEDRRTFNGVKPPMLSNGLWKELDYLYAIRNTILELPNAIKTFLPVISENSTNEEVADIIKEYFNISENTSYNDARKSIEKKGIIVASINGVSISEMRGIAIYFDNLPIIGINNNDVKNAKLFTLYHELVHLLRKNSSLCSVDISDYNDVEEKKCNEIAANILMPIAKLEKIMEYGQIDYNNIYNYAKKLNVSCFALLVRLYKLNKINYELYKKMYNYCENNYYEYLQNNKNKDKVFVKYEVKFINKNGLCFVNSIINEYGSGNISFGETCLLLNINSSHYDEIVKRSAFSE